MPDIRPTVLVVEDDPLTLRMLTVMLERRGHHVLPAVDGRDGMRILTRTRPDLVVLDLMMPRMNGFQFLRALAERGLDDLPVVVVSAKTDPVDRHWAAKLGAKAFVAKPFTNGHLLETVDRAMVVAAT